MSFEASNAAGTSKMELASSLSTANVGGASSSPIGTGSGGTGSGGTGSSDSACPGICWRECESASSSPVLTKNKSYIF